VPNSQVTTAPNDGMYETEQCNQQTSAGRAMWVLSWCLNEYGGSWF